MENKTHTYKSIQTIKKHFFLVVFLFSLIHVNAQKITDDTLYITQTKEEYTINRRKGKEHIVIKVPSKKITRRAVTNTTVVMGASVAAMGILFTMPESVTNWTEEDKQFDNIVEKWKSNINEGPVTDEDNVFLNWVMHPYFGAVYYQSLRGSGYKWYYSFLYSAVLSSLYWEYGVEALAEVPSTQDLIITPVVGSALGEGFFFAKKKIKQNNDRVLNSLFLGRTSLFLLDPLNEVYDIFLRRKIKRNKRRGTNFSSMIVPQNRGLTLNLQFTF